MTISPATLDPVRQLSSALDLLTKEVRLEADNVVSVTFVDPAGRDFPEWAPGAHLEIELPSGLRRQYSLCGSPQDRSRLTIAVLKEPEGRGGSREVHEIGLVGRVLRATLRNHFELISKARYVFIAGGIGITPLLSMVEAVADTADWTLYYTGRSRSRMAFVDRLEALGGERVVLNVRDTQDRLNLEEIFAGLDESTAVYCCGPASLIAAVQDAHERLAPRSELRFERFEAASRENAPAAPLGADQPVTLELRQTGATIDVPAHCSLLDAIREVVPGMPFSCTEGYCGSCEVAVLAGTPDHRDEILTPDEREKSRTMFPCVSRALTDRLVLDI